MKKTIILAGLLATTSSIAIWISSLSAPPAAAPLGPMVKAAWVPAQPVPAQSSSADKLTHRTPSELHLRLTAAPPGSRQARVAPPKSSPVFLTNTKRIARHERHGTIAQTMGWAPSGPKAKAIKQWLQERKTTEQSLLAQARTPSNIATFNGATKDSAEQLKQTFGTQAASLALRLNLRRINPNTLALESITLSGSPILTVEDD